MLPSTRFTKGVFISKTDYQVLYCCVLHEHAFLLNRRVYRKTETANNSTATVSKNDCPLTVETKTVIIITVKVIRYTLHVLQKKKNKIKYIRLLFRRFEIYYRIRLLWLLVCTINQIYQELLEMVFWNIAHIVVTTKY